MNFKRKCFTINILLCVISFAMLTSCAGQNGKVSISKNNTKQDSVGSIVVTLDSKANLIYQDKQNNYWFASKDFGVYKYDNVSLVLFTPENGLCSSNIISIQEDSLGNLYFDTPEGVCKFDGKIFTTLAIIESNEWKSAPNDLWFRMGWDYNGPFRFDGENLYHLSFPKNKMEDEFNSKHPNVSYNPYGVYSIYKDSKDHLWFGTSNLGIYKYDGKEMRWMYENHLTETPAGGSFGIRSIIEDNEGFFWICHSKYKYKLLADTLQSDMLKPLNYERQIGVDSSGLENLYFLSMTKDNNGDIWMVSYDNGVWRYNGETLINYPINNGESNIPLFTIYKDNKGELWVGTQNDGTYKFNGDEFEKFYLN